MVTVLLPTNARPSLLELALRSIAEQTGLAKIGRVLVSENGGDRGSQLVCQKFGQLPITYLFQDPPLTSLAHAQHLMKEHLQGELTAILHDDDWWLPNHLADATAALEAHPDASVYGANLVIRENGVYRTELNCSLLPWVAANYPEPATVWHIAHAHVLVASMIQFMVHYSSMVVRTAALREAAYIYDLGNPYDNDRMVLFALSRLGPVLFNPTASVVVLAHANRETVRFAEDERNERMCQTTRWMVESSGKAWPAIAAALAQRLIACPEPKVKAELLRDAVNHEWCLPEIARHLDREKEKEFFAMYDRARAAFATGRP